MRPLALVLLVMAVAPLALAGRDYYEVLGIEKQATDKDIKRVRAQPHCL
jgi:preprotein translocase subunit Sec63